MKKKILIAVLLILILALGGGWYWYNRTHQSKKDTYTLGTVNRDNISLTVDATGTIEPDNSVDLSATASGTLEKVYVKQNEKVTKEFSLQPGRYFLSGNGQCPAGVSECPGCL